MVDCPMSFMIAPPFAATFGPALAPTLAPTLAQAAGLFMHAAIAGAGAAAVAIPIAIHLLSRLRRKKQPWAAMRFILEAYRRQKQRLLMENWLLLVVRCLIVLVLGLALAQPLVGGLVQGVGLQQEGRLVHLVIDDSLSSRARQAGGRARFEALREKALQSLAQLGPTDRVAIWLASRPMEGLLRPPTTDVAQAERLLENLQPRFGRSALDQTLAELNLLLEDAIAPSRVYIVILSDFARHTLDLNQAEGEGVWASLAQKATIRLNRPLTAPPNAQIARMTPKRAMLLVGGSSPANIPLEVQLRRFAQGGSSGEAVVRLEAYAPGRSEPIVSQDTRHRWPEGQSRASFTARLTIEPGAVPWQGQGGSQGSQLLDPASAQAQIAIRARLVGQDALSEDDTRWATVNLRRGLNVALVEAASPPGESEPRLQASRWLSLALDPAADETAGQAVMNLIEIPADRLGQRSTSSLDAALVLRPDLLRDGGWEALRSVASSGGLVWVFVPPAGGPPTLWGQAMRQRMGVPWRIGLDVEAYGQAGDGGPEGLTAGGRADGPEPAEPWALLPQDNPPEPLASLASDWEPLLRPVEVYRRVGLEKIRNAGDVWLWLRQPKTAQPELPQGPDQGSPLLVSAPVGQGMLLLMGTAIDTDWTNLPTKPLFVPLLHASLRGVVGSAKRARRQNQIVSGDRPRLGPRWAAAQRLEGPEAVSVRLQRRVGQAGGDEEAEPVRALQQPGIYNALPEPKHPLAVNVDPLGGDTRAVQAGRLEATLNRSEADWAWFNPETVLTGRARRASLSWPLLWGLLGLIGLETLLARWFSHAESGRTGPGTLRRLWTMLRESST